MTHKLFTGCEPNAKALAHLMAEALVDADEGIWGDPNEAVEPIEDADRDGFIAWTGGGYEVCLASSVAHHAWGGGTAPKAIQRIIDAQDCSGDWARQHPDLPSHIEAINSADNSLCDLAQQFESDWWMEDDSYFFWKARIIYEPKDCHNGDGEHDYVHVDAYLNTDLEYGRDFVSYGGGDQTVGNWKRAYTIAEFEALTEADMEALVADMIANVGKEGQDNEKD